MVVVVEMITEDDFREFVFSNPVRLWTAVNLDFFKGTVEDSEGNRWLAAG